MLRSTLDAVEEKKLKKFRVNICLDLPTSPLALYIEEIQFNKDQGLKGKQTNETPSRPMR